MKLSKKQISISYPKQDNNDFMKLKYVNTMPPSWWQISAQWQVDTLYTPGCVCKDAGSRGHF